MPSGRLLSYLKKRKISRNGHSLSFVELLVVTCCHSLYHSLLFVVTHCHSLSLDVPLVCAFINDLLEWFREEACACEHVLNILKCFVTAISLLFKSCVHSILATLSKVQKNALVKLGKTFFVSLQKLFQFLRKSKLRTLDIQIS